MERYGFFPFLSDNNGPSIKEIECYHFGDDDFDQEEINCFNGTWITWRLPTKAFQGLGLYNCRLPKLGAPISVMVEVMKNGVENVYWWGLVGIGTKSIYAMDAKKNGLEKVREEIKNANYPEIRFFPSCTADTDKSQDPKLKGKWSV